MTTLSRDDVRSITCLHRVRPGLYRVGASELYIRRHVPRGDWGVYVTTLHGDARIRGAWCFATLAAARARAFEVAEALGHAYGENESHNRHA